MNPISVYVAISAITFVKCEFSYNTTGAVGRQFITASQKENWKAGMLTGVKRNVDNDHVFRNEIDSSGAPYVTSWGKEKETNKEGINDFYRGWRHFKKIYEKCWQKINQRLKKLVNTKVKHSLRKYISDFKERAVSMYNCVKVSSFRSLDEVLEEKYIPVSPYVYFVKDETKSSVNPFGWNISSRSVRPSLSQYAKTILDKNWSTLVFERLNTLLRSHFLKFRLSTSMEDRGRRRRDHRMFAMMVMGFMIMVSVLIPMGFQFLTVLGGKSLLMAKMALIMSAINGLKKIATSNVGYGFYHTGNDGHHHDHIHHGFHDKLYQNPQPQYAYNS